ncbi:hypothetical protein ACFU8W_49340 [Streptomyces sp. NPDC057565]|uniref:hypothetical protein n=1 Tax=Streptomyces sp. NPDC057565 TaxID=3346169 RepID=UPI0036972BE8
MQHPARGWLALLCEALRQGIEHAQAEAAQPLPFQDDPFVIPVGQQVAAVQQAHQRGINAERLAASDDVERVLGEGVGVNADVVGESERLRGAANEFVAAAG